MSVPRKHRLHSFTQHPPVGCRLYLGHGPTENTGAPLLFFWLVRWWFWAERSEPRKLGAIALHSTEYQAPRSRREEGTEKPERRNGKQAGRRGKVPREGTVSKQEWLPVKYCREPGTWVWKEATVSDISDPFEQR